MPETETVTGSADFSGVRTYVYDDAGNLTSKTTSGDYGAKSESYVYDAFGKLIKYLENGEEKASYKYNGNGQRVEKTVNGAKTKYYWDGANIKNEGTASAVNATNYFGANGVFARKSGSSVNVLYKNGHGDTVLLTNGNTVVRDYEYDAYGKERGISPADENPFRYSGEYFDSETGFIYLRNRYYDPSSARFISEDTHWNVENCIYGDSETGNRPTTPNIGAIIQSSNLSAYCMGNPIMYVDYEGEFVISTALIVGISIGALIGAGIGAYVGYQVAEKVGVEESERWKFVVGYGLGGALIGGVIGGVIGYGIHAAIGVAAGSSATAVSIQNAISNVDASRIDHILNGSKGKDHMWGKLMNKVDWNGVKYYIQETMKTGETTLKDKYVNNDVTTMVYETVQEYKGVTVKVIYNVIYGIVNITDAYVVS